MPYTDTETQLGALLTRILVNRSRLSAYLVVYRPPYSALYPCHVYVEVVQPELSILRRKKGALRYEPYLGATTTATGIFGIMWATTWIERKNG